MSEPLELTIHPHDPKHLNTNWLTMYVTPDGPMAAGRSGVLPAAKHLTDAELAAEYHNSNARAWFARAFGRTSMGDQRALHVMQAERAEEEMDVFHRFATSPHYFEADQ